MPLWAIYYFTLIIRYFLFTFVDLIDELPSKDFQYDVFISFSTLDYNWVRDNLTPVLERKRINYCIHSRDFIVGKAIIENIADSVYNSRKVLAIISHNYLSSHFCREELEIALHRCTEMADSSLLLIRVDHVDRDRLPKTLRRRTFLDYASALERMDWERRLLKHIDFDDKNSVQLGSPSASADKVQLLGEQSNVKRVWSADVAWRRNIYEMWAGLRTRLTIIKSDKRDVNNTWVAVTALLIDTYVTEEGFHLQTFRAIRRPF